MSETPTIDDNTYQAVYQAIVKDLSNGYKKPQIVKDLVKKGGWEEQTATDLVDQVEADLIAYKNSPEGKADLLKKHKKNMIFGALWAIGGTVVTTTTYEQATEEGGTYIVAYGAILIGIFQFLMGLGGWIKASR